VCQHLLSEEGVFNTLMGSLIQCSPKKASSFSEEEWDAYRSGQNLSTLTRSFAVSDGKKIRMYACATGNSEAV